MKLKTMENALVTYPNRFQLTMMAVARAKEINDGESPLVDFDDQSKPVVVALREIAEGRVIPGTHEQMNRIRDAKRVLRDRALREAEAAGITEEPQEDDSYASAKPEEDPAGS